MNAPLNDASTGELPFGAGALESSEETGSNTSSRKKATKKATKKSTKKVAKKTTKKATTKKAATKKATKKATTKKASTKKASSKKATTKKRVAEDSSVEAPEEAPEPKVEAVEPQASEPTSEESEAPAKQSGDAESGGGEAADFRPGESAGARRRRRWKERRKKKRAEARAARAAAGESPDGKQDRSNKGGQRQDSKKGHKGQKGQKGGGALEECVGLLVIEHANHGHLHQKANGYRPTKQDVHVSPKLVQKYGLRTGSMIKGTRRKGHGRHKWDLHEVLEIDGKHPKEVRNLPAFKKLTSIDPDFHYEVGDGSGETSLKVIDILCPIGRGQRGLIVAPPRSGKTILLQQYANAIEKIYPEVHLMVLLVDERPEEATEWMRSTNGEVFVSTNDEMHKTHVELCEAVWARAKRLVELGEDVILLLDSITRMGRAYNNVKGNSGKTMSGGVDTRALERPKQFFGSARNTERAGSLTILATCLVETGSRMDQVIFEEFKGTGNMELVLSRKLADRRIFPAIDVVKTGTRKEEKLLSSRRLRWVNTLRRVLLRMHFAEAMELLITKLDDVEKIDDFLSRFEVDPEA